MVLLLNPMLSGKIGIRFHYQNEQLKSSTSKWQQNSNNFIHEKNIKQTYFPEEDKN